MRESDRGRDPGLRPKQRIRNGLLRVSLGAALLSVPGAGPGCHTSCDDGDDSDDPPVVYDGGTRDEALTYYETHAWDGRYLRFPPQRTYDLVHGLGRAPTAVMSYVGFNETPLGATGNGNVSIAAGNEVIIEWVDDSVIRVRNDTCETFYLRVVALAPNEPVVDGAGGAEG
jgi:hypothetical protein